MVAPSEWFRAGILKMDTELPGRGDVFRSAARSPRRLHGMCNWNACSFCLEKFRLAFWFKIVLLWMRTKAVKEHLILRRYNFFWLIPLPLMSLEAFRRNSWLFKSTEICSCCRGEKKKGRPFWIYIRHFSKINSFFITVDVIVIPSWLSMTAGF